MCNIPDRPDFLTRFDSVSGKRAALRRWAKEQTNIEQAIIAYAGGEIGKEVTLEEAINYVVNEPQFAASRGGKTAAAKFLNEKLGLNAPQEVSLQDNRKVEVHYNIYTFDDEVSMQEYIEQIAEFDIPLADDIAAQVEEQGSPPYKVKVEV